MRNDRWPAEGLVAVPGDGEAAALAEAIRDAVLGEEREAPLRDLQDVLALAGARAKPRKLGDGPGSLEALLMPLDGDRFAIHVDARPPGGWGARSEPVTAAHRARFRVAHELGHTFFYSRPGGRPKRSLPDSPAQERFADRFAAELLVPAAAVRRCEGDAHAIFRLHRQFGVSVQLAARRIAEVEPSRRVAVWWHDGHALRLQWATRRLPVHAVAIETRALGGPPPAAVSWSWSPDRGQLVACG